MKICTDCGTEKPISEFYWKKTGISRQSACKTCSAAKSRAWGRKNSEHRNRTRKARRERRRRWFYDWLSLQHCEECGENDPVVLELHHLDPDEKEGNVTEMLWWGALDRVKKEIEKCVVLCANCHRRVHMHMVDGIKRKRE